MARALKPEAEERGVSALCSMVALAGVPSALVMVELKVTV